jgi:hypothetical protein
MCLSLSAYVILFCLFLPKLRVVILKPNKNVRSKNNMVKSMYNKSMQNNEQRLTVNRPVITTQHSITNQITEKSVTVGTGASTSSTLSSPSIFKNIFGFFRI